MESMPPGVAPIGSGSGMSVTTTSDVRKVLATEAAFSSAHRTTCVSQTSALAEMLLQDSAAAVCCKSADACMLQQCRACSSVSSSQAGVCLGGVDDASLHEVLVLASCGIEADVDVARLQHLHGEPFSSAGACELAANRAQPCVGKLTLQRHCSELSSCRGQDTPSA